MRTFCDNATANAVLSSKAAAYQSENIPLTLQVSLPKDLPISDTELCSLLGNALDNAFEAVLTLPAALRKVTLKAKVEKGLFLLQVQNPVFHTAAKKGGLFQTTKEDKKSHGFGLDNIKNITLRHGGSFKADNKDNIFTLLVCIPCF